MASLLVYAALAQLAEALSSDLRGSWFESKVWHPIFKCRFGKKSECYQTFRINAVLQAQNSGFGAPHLCGTYSAYISVAQQTERLISNQRVAGAIPAGDTFKMERDPDKRPGLFAKEIVRCITLHGEHALRVPPFSVYHDPVV